MKICPDTIGKILAKNYIKIQGSMTGKLFGSEASTCDDTLHYTIYDFTQKKLMKNYKI